MPQVNPYARMVNDYLMKMALPLGGWFVVIYLLRNAATTNVALSLITTPLALVTPIALWWIIRELRKRLGGYIMGFQAWVFGVQTMFFAGLIEGLFIYVYNQFLRPGNLQVVRDAAIKQYNEVLTALKGLGAYQEWIPKFEETAETLKNAPIETPIETAISALSNDMFLGMIFMIPIALILRKLPKQNNQ